MVIFSMIISERGKEMGIGIYLAISKAVTPKEWEKVYEETLQLVEAFPFVERGEVVCKGVETRCLVKTKEREFISRWNWESNRIGWCAEGDGFTLKRAEEYCLFRDLKPNHKVDSEAEDAILGILPDYIDDTWEDTVYLLWGNKTQGEPYHYLLLAIACLIESRLGEKAFVYGDFNLKQCEKALELMNDYLENPVEEVNLPVAFDLNRLWDRIQKLNFEPTKSIMILEHFYRGKKEFAFGEKIRSNFLQVEWEAYWKEKIENFCECEREQIIAIGEYLAWGFEPERLGKIADLQKIGLEPYERYMKYLNRINEEGNLVDLEEELNKLLENTESFFDRLLNLGKGIEERKRQARKEEPEYDIKKYEDLIFYEDGNSMRPSLVESMLELKKACQEAIREEEYQKLLGETWEKRCQWLAENNRWLVVRDTDWEKIYDDIKEHDTAFARYYPMMRIHYTSDHLIWMCKAYFINDALYQLFSNTE